MNVSWKRIRQLSWFGALALVLCVGSTRCSPPEEGPKTCRYDNECKGEDERCVFENPNCVVTPGQCEGICKAEKEVEKKCDCEKDEDCENYPYFQCTDCQCTDQSHTILACEKDGSCPQGYYCVKGEKVDICQERESCDKDDDCKPGDSCREQVCCNQNAGNCPAECIVGASCASDGDCLSCNMVCKDGQCQSDSTTTCLGQQCVTNNDCAACGAVCQSGRCQNTGTTCTTRRCFTNEDCKAAGGQGVCQAGCCR